MKDYFLKTIIIFACLGFFSCAKIRPPYIISDYPEIQPLEEYDHQYCVSLKLNFDKTNNLESKLYWHCRISFAKFRLEIKPNFPWQMEFNKKISDLIAKISIKISRNQETIIQQELNKIDENDHKKCLKLGYNHESRDKSAIEDYYVCRKNIIELNYSEPPYNNSQYTPYQNKSYDINFIINKRIEESIKKGKEDLKNYPECANYRLVSLDFENCKKATELFRGCIKESNLKIVNRENNEKVVCQKQAYNRFSDEMIRNEDRSELRIRDRNINADRENKSNFTSLGINEEDFMAKAKRLEIKKQQLRKIREGEGNNNLNIYSKQEISRLRKDFIANCLKIIDERVNEYSNQLKQECETLKYRPN